MLFNFLLIAIFRLKLSLKIHWAGRARRARRGGFGETTLPLGTELITPAGAAAKRLCRCIRLTKLGTGYFLDDHKLLLKSGDRS
jgi:hypothetical protein